MKSPTRATQNTCHNNNNNNNTVAVVKGGAVKRVRAVFRCQRCGGERAGKSRESFADRRLFVYGLQRDENDRCRGRHNDDDDMTTDAHGALVLTAYEPRTVVPVQ